MFCHLLQVHARWIPRLLKGLAPFDYAIFPAIKNNLKGHRFESLMELRQATAAVVGQYGSEWYGQVFQRWIHRHRRCVECAGEYFEKN